MAETSIEWTGHVWNPIAGCSVVSPGCTNCYAMKMAARLERMGQDRYAGLTKPSKGGAVWTGEMRLVEDALTLPLRRKKPTTYFVNSMSDLFHENVPDAWIDRVFAVMALCPQHTFQVLTKRSARMRKYVAEPDLRMRVPDVVDTMEPDSVWRFTGHEPWIATSLPLRNVWLGVSAEDQTRADARIPDLLATPATVRFVSAEPLLGPIDFTSIDLAQAEALESEASGLVSVNALTGDHIDGEGVVDGVLGSPDPKIDWIIVGGESGPNARPMHPQWARDIRDQCVAAGVAFFHKQNGEWAPGEIAGPNERSIDSAMWFDGRWLFERVGKSREDDHIDDEPDLFRIGKRRAGRLLDGVEHNGTPEARA